MKKQHILFLDFLFVTILVFLLGFSYLSYERIEKLKSASALVNHSNEVKLNLNRALIFMLDAETGQRGYLLTHDSSFLGEYRNAFFNAGKNVSRVISLTADNAGQQQRGRELQLMINQRFVALNASTSYYNERKHSEANLSQLLLKGKKAMDKARTIANEMILAEDVLLQERTKEKNDANTLTPIVILCFSVFAIIFVVAAYIRLRKETHLRMFAQDGEASSREMNLLLESKVNERTRELQEKNIALEQMNDELISFNYVASHDLQEPLRKIHAFTYRILDTDKNLSKTTQDYFSRITAAVSRMQNLLEALINYSRASNTDEDYVKTDLNQLLEEVKTDINESIEEKKAVITNDLLPTVNVISLQFHQLFLNLLANSIKYSRPDVAPQIKISAAITDVADIKKDVSLHYAKYWKFTFEDNGIGFGPQYEDKIFELFQRLHAKTEFEGTGIGLAICRKILQNHNGYIFAEGRPESGATFIVYLPVVNIKDYEEA
ncbi:MAG TPA: CHASE3 domain-containing protein [Flavobacterium sp.]|nr:CHASE3 domain-containing protein [Flavobacterium sp.]